MHVQPERIALGIYLVRLRRILQFLEGFAGTNAPAVCLYTNEGRRVIVGLEKVVGVEVGGKIGGDELGVLTSGLFMRVSGWWGRRKQARKGDLRRRCLFPSDHSSDR